MVQSKVRFVTATQEQPGQSLGVWRQCSIDATRWWWNSGRRRVVRSVDVQTK